MRNWRPHRRYSALTTAGGGVLLTKPQDGTAIVVRDLDAPTMSIALFPSVVVACVAGVLLAIAAGAFACARAQAKVRRMTDALDHMSQGLCMFDAAGRIVICNRPYLRMYKLSPDVVNRAARCAN
jgi:PAS domain-containing protein